MSTFTEATFVILSVEDQHQNKYHHLHQHQHQVLHLHQDLNLHQHQNQKLNQHQHFYPLDKVFFLHQSVENKWGRYKVTVST